MNEGLGFFTSICPSAGHLQALHGAIGALEGMECKAASFRGTQEDLAGRHCSGQAAAGSHLDEALQLNDIACMPEAHGLARRQALIAWLWLLEGVGRIDPRGCRG